MRKLVPALFGINAMIAFSSLLVFGVTFAFASSYTHGVVDGVDGIDIASTRPVKEIYRSEKHLQPSEENRFVVQKRQRRNLSRKFPMEGVETHHVVESSTTKQKQQVQQQPQHQNQQHHEMGEEIMSTTLSIQQATITIQQQSDNGKELPPCDDESVGGLESSQAKQQQHVQQHQQQQEHEEGQQKMSTTLSIQHATVTFRQNDAAEGMSTTSTFPLSEGGGGLEPDEIGYIVGASVCVFMCCCGIFCVWYDHQKRKAAKEREHRMMMSIFKYVQVFDVDDIDIRRTPAGGYECTYLNDLAYGGNLAPAGSQYSSRGGLSRSSPKRTIDYVPSTTIRKDEIASDHRGGSKNSKGSQPPSLQGSDDYMFMSGTIKYPSSQHLDT